MRAPLSPPRGSHDERIDQVITRCYLNFDNANINEHTPLWNADRRRRALDRWPWFVDAIVMGKELLAPEFESHVLEVGGEGFRAALAQRDGPLSSEAVEGLIQDADPAVTWRLASRRDLSPQVYRRLESREQVGRGGIALDACEARVEHDWKELITEWQETARRQGLDIEPPVFGLEGEMDASREEVDDEAGADRGLFLAYLDRFENIEAEMERARDYWSAEIHANPRRADTAFRMCIEDVLRTQRLARTLCYPGSPAWEFRRNRRNLALPADTPLPLVRGVYETLLETVRDDLDLPGRTPMFWYVNNSGMATAVSDTDIEFSDEHRYEVVDNVDELLAHHAYSGERSVDPHFVRPEWAGSDRFHAWVVPV